MADESTQRYNQDLVVLDAGGDDYDPLAEDSPGRRDPGNPLAAAGYVGDPGALAPRSVVPPAPEKTPREKIDILFSMMIPFKRYLLAIMEFCKEPKDFAELDTFITELQSKRRTIYSTVDFCMMLEDAEAISKVTEEGTPYEEVKVEPVEVERDGQVFLEPGAPPPIFWQLTEGGFQVLEEDDPLRALQAVFEDQAEFKSVYLQVLELCDQEGGISINDMKEIANKNTTMHYPSKTALYFLDFLDRNAAVIWDKKWKTTSVGKQALELLRSEGVQVELRTDMPIALPAEPSIEDDGTGGVTW